MSRIHRDALYRQLISRLDALHLGPGDLLTVTFPTAIYESPLTLRDAERFAQAVASLAKHEVVILKEGVHLSKFSPQPDIRVVASGNPDLRI